MSILDDAIREHLELKRAHGADEAELKRLEDEAFGPPERPDQVAEQVDPFAEAPTEFLASPQAPESPPSEPTGGDRELPNVADLQEPPPPRPVEPEESAADAAAEGPDDRPEDPGEEPHPAAEHQAIAQPAPGDRPAPPSDELRPDPEAPPAEASSAEGRSAAAEQPTQLFDVEAEFEDTAESASPSDEQLVDAERSEPRLAPADPLAGIEDADTEAEAAGPAPEEDEAAAEPEDEFDEFFSEQRLSDELNQALEAPLPDEPEDAAEHEEPEHAPAEHAAEHAPPEDAPEDAPAEHAPAEDEPPGDPEDAAEDHRRREPGHADALEDTPDFLEESPEDDEAWFEQRPPKDFDF